MAAGAYGKGQAQSYSDFIKNRSSIEKEATEDEVQDQTKMSPADKRKAAIKRRLIKNRKPGK